MKASVKQRLECFVDNLPSFIKEQENYIAKRKQGYRPKKKTKYDNA
jgi:hypothetical protein